MFSFIIQSPEPSFATSQSVFMLATNSKKRLSKSLLWRESEVKLSGKCFLARSKKTWIQSWDVSAISSPFFIKFCIVQMRLTDLLCPSDITKDSKFLPKSKSPPKRIGCSKYLSSLGSQPSQQFACFNTQHLYQRCSENWTLSLSGRPCVHLSYWPLRIYRHHSCNPSFLQFLYETAFLGDKALQLFLDL